MTKILRLILDGLLREWCSYTHRGGQIDRDSLGRINWQCCKCGRWAHPVREIEEIEMTNKQIITNKIHKTINKA